MPGEQRQSSLELEQVRGMEIHDNSTNNNTPTTAKSISNDREDWHSDHGTDRVDSIEKTKRSALRVAEIVLPIIHRLKPVLLVHLTSEIIRIHL